MKFKDSWICGVFSIEIGSRRGPSCYLRLAPQEINGSPLIHNVVCLNTGLLTFVEEDQNVVSCRTCNNLLGLTEENR